MTTTTDDRMVFDGVSGLWPAGWSDVGLGSGKPRIRMELGMWEEGRGDLDYVQ